MNEASGSDFFYAGTVVCERGIIFNLVFNLVSRIVTKDVRKYFDSSRPSTATMLVDHRSRLLLVKAYASFNNFSVSGYTSLFTVSGSLKSPPTVGDS